MENHDRQDLIINIENSIAFIESHLASADKTVESVFKRHGVSDLEKASLTSLYDIFSELYAIEADLD